MIMTTRLLIIIIGLILFQFQGISQEIRTVSKVVKEYGQKTKVEYSYYKEGMKTIYHGSYKTYFSDGKLQSDRNYKDGKLDGLSRFYEYNGAILSEINYKEGKPEGSSKQYSNGKVESETNYSNGILNGKYVRYYPDGKLMLEGTNINGKIDITKYGFEDGSYIVVDRSKDVEGYNLYDKNNELVFTTKQEAKEFDRLIPGDCQNVRSTTLSYPNKAKEQNKQGIVILKYTVGTDGKLKNIEAVIGFDKSAIDEAIRSMKKLYNCFDIAIKDDVPVEYTKYQGVKFILVD
jgi:hypothetical protein